MKWKSPASRLSRAHIGLSPALYARAALGPMALLSVLLWTPPALAGALEIQVTGITTGKGEVGCALYNGPDGFPTDPSKAIQQWKPATTGGVTCRFEGLAPGAYAVAVSHDLNGNRKTDTNFVGLPKESWGVTNNSRPSLRAPRFEEASVSIAPGQTISQTVRIAR